MVGKSYQWAFWISFPNYLILSTEKIVPRQICLFDTKLGVNWHKLAKFYVILYIRTDLMSVTRLPHSWTLFCKHSFRPSHSSYKLLLHNLNATTGHCKGHFQPCKCSEWILFDKAVTVDRKRSHFWSKKNRIGKNRKTDLVYTYLLPLFRCVCVGLSAQLSLWESSDSSDAVV